jgi:hypothetical protein
MEWAFIVFSFLPRSLSGCEDIILLKPFHFYRPDELELNPTLEELERPTLLLKSILDELNPKELLESPIELLDKPIELLESPIELLDKPIELLDKPIEDVEFCSS